MARGLLAVAAVTVGLLAAGCSASGDDGLSDSQRWAGEVCAAAAGWRTDVGNAIDDLPDRVLAAGSLDEAVAAVDGTLDELVERSRAAVVTIRTTPLPETEARRALEAEVDEVSTAIDDMGTTVERARDAAGEGLSELVSAVGEAVSVAGGTLTTVTESWDEIDHLDLTAELENAIAEDPGCQDLRRA